MITAGLTEISRNGFLCASEHQGESAAGQHGIKFFPPTEINPMRAIISARRPPWQVCPQV
jgi:hypothetical protein